MCFRIDREVPNPRNFSEMNVGQGIVYKDASRCILKQLMLLEPHQGPRVPGSQGPKVGNRLHHTAEIHIAQGPMLSAASWSFWKRSLQFGMFGSSHYKKIIWGNVRKYCHGWSAIDLIFPAAGGSFWQQASSFWRCPSLIHTDIRPLAAWRCTDMGQVPIPPT